LRKKVRVMVVRRIVVRVMVGAMVMLLCLLSMLRMWQRGERDKKKGKGGKTKRDKKCGTTVPSVTILLKLDKIFENSDATIFFIHGVWTAG
jgi:hypothetical protein